MPLKSSKRHISKRLLGNRGEQAIADYLVKQGYTIIATNYQKRSGEIDLIAQKNELIAFIEVKLRTKNYFNISEVITFSKQRKIIATAQRFILEQSLFNHIYRFDVALVEYNNDNSVITYIKNAFTKE